MDSAKNSAKKVVALLDEGCEGSVFVVPHDRDKFCVTVVEAIQACKLVDTGYSFVSQVADLRDELARWIEERQDAIQSAYISFRESGILFVVVQKDVQRNESLAKDLTDLDILIATDERFSLLDVEVLSLPRSSKDAIKAFISSGKVATYAGEE